MTQPENTNHFTTVHHVQNESPESSKIKCWAVMTDVHKKRSAMVSNGSTLVMYMHVYTLPFEGYGSILNIVFSKDALN